MQFEFLTNNNKELVYNILQLQIKNKFHIILSDIPEFIRIFDDTFIDTERSIGNTLDTTNKNKRVISSLYKYINNWVSGQTFKKENKSEILNRNYETAKQDFAKYMPQVHKPQVDLQEQLNNEAITQNEKYFSINTDEAYSNMLSQREQEEVSLRELHKKDEKKAVAWLNSSTTPIDVQNTENHNKLSNKSNIVNYDKLGLTIDDIKSNTQKQHVTKTVMFDNNVDVIENSSSNEYNTNVSHEPFWWNKIFQKNPLNIEEKTLVTKNLTNNIVSLNEKFLNYNSLHINNIALPNSTIYKDNEFGIEIQKKICDIPYIYVEIYVNGKLLNSSSTQTRFMYRQDKHVGNYIYFTCNQCIKQEMANIISTINLHFYDEYEEPLNIAPIIKMETLINGTQIINKINKNTKFNDAEVSYIKVMHNGGEFSPNDVIQINDTKYKINGVCKINIRGVDNINIEGLNQQRDYNTMIIKLDKEINIDAKILNLSRLPMIIVQIVNN